MTTDMAPRLFGARVKRTGDPRFLTGRAKYVSDVSLPGMVHASFARSTEAHARIISVDATEARRSDGVRAVFVGDQWKELGIECVSSYPGFQVSTMPILAHDKVRYSGEATAMVIADDQYLAEDGAGLVYADYEPLPPVLNAEAALADGAQLVHDHWTGNQFVERSFTSEGYAEALATAPNQISHSWTMGRHSGIPIETRAVLADFEPGRDQLTVWTSTQIPHLVKTGIALALRRSENSIRVIAPDVGGGFGVKAQLYPEEVACAAAAIELGVPVKWVEDRREHFLTAHHSREHTHKATMAYDEQGRVLAYGVEILVNMGPYSVLGYPVATNKAPYGAYRGVSRPAACFTTERMLDQIARERDLDPVELRKRNLLGTEDYPHESVGGLIYDSGTVRECLETILEMVDYPGLRSDQQSARDQGRLVGIGVVPFIEQTAHTTKEFVQRGVPIVFGYETTKLRLSPDGRLTLSSSIHDHGQGLETTLAQMVADQLGLGLNEIRVEYGDTDQVPYGSGTFASRSAVLAGGAARIAATRLADKLARIAGHILEISPEDLQFGGGRITVKGAPTEGVEISELCRIAYQRPEQLPEGEDPSLEETATYDAPPGTGTYTSAAHLAVVEVDPKTGKVHIDRYAVVEDCGTMINPTIVEGQIFGGVAQGIGSALFEEFLYDDAGQLLTTTFMDYLVPTATDIPDIEIRHLETPSPTTLGGIKGVGEGGSIAPGAVLAAAVEDALAPLGQVVVDQLPLTPERVLGWIKDAEEDQP